MNIHIIYCGGWGYGPRFKTVKAVLESNIPGIAITFEATPDTTGYFEVINVKTKKVYHSKKDGGGYLDNDKAKLAKVLEEVKADAASETAAAKK